MENMQFEQVHLSTPYIPSEATRRACQAEYHMDRLLKGDLQTRKNVAAWHGTTIEEMKNHQRCVHRGVKCFDERK